MTDSTGDHLSPALERLLRAVAEEAMFMLAGGPGDSRDAISGLVHRRTEAHTATMQGRPIPDMLGSFDAWALELAKASAGVSPPDFVPMAGVLAEKVTLAAGARGIRSLFSSKPNDKDEARVRRLGGVAVEAARAVFSADGSIDEEEARSLSWLIASLGLGDADAQKLATLPPVAAEKIEMGGDVDSGIAKALVRGAWLVATEDGLDPREEDVVRMLAHRVSVTTQEVEHARNEAVATVDLRRATGVCATEGVRYVLADRAPTEVVALATRLAQLAVPRRFREEILAQIAHGGPVALGRRHIGLPHADRTSTLGIVWAAALHENPTLARKATLRARFDRFAADCGDEGGRVRTIVEGAVDEALAIAAAQ